MLRTVIGLRLHHVLHVLTSTATFYWTGHSWFITSEGLLEVETGALTFSSLSTRCILSTKAIKASLLLQRPILEHDFSQAEWNHTVCLACVSNISVLVSGSPSSMWCQNSFDHYTETSKDNTSPLKTIARAWQPLLTKDHGLSCTQISLAFCTSAKVSNCPLAFRVMANLRNHKWRWTHRGPTKTLEQHSSQCGSCIVFNTTLCRRGSAGEGTGTAVLSCS